MEYRKLISFGKNSYIVSLPKSWVQNNKLKKGDLIYIEEKTDEISLYPRHKPEENKSREVVIDVDGKNMPQISREITNAYINNFSTFVVTGKELSANAKTIRSILQNFMALEIMDQTATKMVAKDFIELGNISLNDLTRKMDMITREMIRDSKNTLLDSKYENLYLRDEDVNRIVHLVHRIVRQALENPQLAKKLGHMPVELLTLWRVSYTIECIADEAKRVAKYLDEAVVSKSEAEEITAVYSLVESLYLTSMKAFYNKDRKVAFSLAGTKTELIVKCNELGIKYKKNKNIVSAVEKIKNMVLMTNEIGRITSNLPFEEGENRGY